jgi:uncharacterized protein YyaL (SSP411 family)
MPGRRAAKPDFARVVEETVAWVMPRNAGPGGRLFSALDADSEGEEGKYYVWDRDEVASIC